MSSQDLPTRVIAGVTVPSTPLIDGALELAQKYMDPIGYNHVARSWVTGILLISRLPTGQREALDIEAFSIASILHDLGWSTSPNVRSRDKIFEVDGANAARAFIRREGDKTAWDKHRIQLLWDCIALHTLPEIAPHKEPEVAHTSTGVFVELFGADFGKELGLDISQEALDQIAEVFPREGLKSYVKDVMCGFCREKPDVTYKTFVGGFGDRFVEGYSSDGKRGVDLLTIGLKE